MSYAVYFRGDGTEIVEARKDWGFNDGDNGVQREGASPGIFYWVAYPKGDQPPGPGNIGLVHYDPTDQIRATNLAEARREATLAAESNPIWVNPAAMTEAERNAGKTTVGTLGKKESKAAAFTSTGAAVTRGANLSVQKQTVSTQPTTGGPAEKTTTPTPVADVVTVDTDPTTIDDQTDDRLTDVWRDVTVVVNVRGKPLVEWTKWRTWAWLGFWYAQTATLVYPKGHVIVIIEGDHV